MSANNSVQLIGYVGQDPEIKNIDGGNKLAVFSLAVSEVYKNKSGEKVQNTHWFRCQLWGARASVIENYVKKGDRIAIQGKLKQETYTDKSGSKISAVKVAVDDFTFLSNRNLSGQSQNSISADNSGQSLTPDDDLPF